MSEVHTTSYTTDQWLRKCSLTLVGSTQADGTAKAIDLSMFRIRFQLRQADPSAAKPNTAWIRVYNLNPSTVVNLIAEYTSVVLQAGYQTGKFGVIFQGTIKQFRRGHETVTDSFFDIMAADGDLAHNFAVVSKKLDKGWQNKDDIKASLDAMEQYGVTAGYSGVQQVGAGPGGVRVGALRGAAKFGMATANLDTATADAGATWMIVNGKVQIVPLKGYLPGEAVVLNSKTGLIGWPEATESGIYARCLLNPAIKCQGLVQINNSSINQTTINPNTEGGLGGIVGIGAAFPGEKDFRAFAATSEDGFYRVLVVEHEGDTRGQPWYTNIICLLADLSQARALTQMPQTGVNDQTVPLPADITTESIVAKGGT